MRRLLSCTSTSNRDCLFGWFATSTRLWGATQLRLIIPIIATWRGIKQPFQWTVAHPQGRFTVQLDQIEVNVPVEEARFAKPQAPPSANGH